MSSSAFAACSILAFIAAAIASMSISGAGLVAGGASVSTVLVSIGSGFDIFQLEF